MAATFRGWPVEALEFFEGLEADNTKAYWQAHKSDYETLVRAPMDLLLAELAPEWGGGRVHRPYRDIRFSKDKSPYRTEMGAMIGPGYVQLSATGLGAGSGMWEMAPDQLERYRAAVDAGETGAALEGIVAALRKDGTEVTARDTLKSSPKGYPKDHPRVELLRFKGIVAWRQWPAGAWLGTKKAKQRVVEFLHSTGPLREWLDLNVGPTTMPEARRR
ncbi:MAG: DUF2461 domain-containing protein [Actinomycetota bacterium]